MELVIGAMVSCWETIDGREREREKCFLIFFEFLDEIERGWTGLNYRVYEGTEKTCLKKRVNVGSCPRES